MLLIWADDVLRAKSQVLEEGSTRRRLGHLAVVLCTFGIFYGGIMGSFCGIFGRRILQVIYSGVKVPLLLMVTFGLSLPFFFVINSLFGLRADFKRVLRALVASQAGLTVILASLSPLTILWYVSFDNYRAAILFNAFMFGIASFGAQSVLKRFYGPLIANNHIHTKMLKIWLVIYAFVGIQMGWVLRPFIGDPDSPTQFFREGAWGNAYMKLVEITLNLFR